MGKTEWDNACTQVNACALTGATAFFAGIPDAVVVVNGPLWCSFYARRYLEKQCPSLPERFFCSQADNEAVVYGTEACLLETLATVKEKRSPSVLLIINNCSVGLIGDDLAGIARQAEFDCPVVCMDGGGLSGGFWEGYRAAVQKYFETVELQPRGMINLGTINLLGLSFGYYNAANDVQELEGMLIMAGYRVQACPGLGTSVSEMEAMSHSELNLVVHEELGGELARQLKKQYDMPYISLLPPYGIEQTLLWLKNVGIHMQLKSKDTLNLLEKEANSKQLTIRTAVTDMERIWGDLWFENAVVAAPASVAMGMAKALRLEWADIGKLTVVAHDGLPSLTSPQCVDSILDGGANSEEIQMRLRSLPGGLLLGSGSEKAFLRQQSVPDTVCCNISLPVYDEVVFTGRPFMGLRGAANLLERLWNGYAAEKQREKN